MDKVLYFATLEGVFKNSFIHHVFCGYQNDQVLKLAKRAWAEDRDYIATQCDKDDDPATSGDVEAIIEVYRFEVRYRSETACFEPLSSSIKHALMFTDPIKYKWNQWKLIFLPVSS